MTHEDKKRDARLIIDFFHRLMMHHAMWFSEVRKSLGDEEAYLILEEAWEKGSAIQIERLSKTLGFELEDGIPAPLLNLPDSKLEELRKSLSVNWLANDGVWFQTVEFSHDIDTAKQCNDNCWAQFSPFEAWSVKRLLGIPDNPGLDGLKKALAFRFYAYVNRHSFTDETNDSFVYTMDECRVQAARRRKGLDDYPCMSAGIVEYTSFAKAIDQHISTECIGCPPERHDGEWYCSWRFSISE